MEWGNNLDWLKNSNLGLIFLVSIPFLLLISGIILGMYAFIITRKKSRKHFYIYLSIALTVIIIASILMRTELVPKIPS